MRSVRIFSLIGLMWMFMLGVNAQGVEKVKAGDAMPAFSLNSEVYGKVTPADLKGKVVLVSLFATWCGPCQLELGQVQKVLWPKYKDNADFKLLVIGREHTDADLKKYNERKKLSTTNGRNSPSRCIQTPSVKYSPCLPTKAFLGFTCSEKTASWCMLPSVIPPKSSST